MGASLRELERTCVPFLNELVVVRHGHDVVARASVKENWHTAIVRDDQSGGRPSSRDLEDGREVDVLHDSGVVVRKQFHAIGDSSNLFLESSKACWRHRGVR